MIVFIVRFWKKSFRVGFFVFLVRFLFVAGVGCWGGGVECRGFGSKCLGLIRFCCVYSFCFFYFRKGVEFYFLFFSNFLFGESSVMLLGGLFRVGRVFRGRFCWFNFGVRFRFIRFERFLVLGGFGGVLWFVV